MTKRTHLDSRRSGSARATCVASRWRKVHRYRAHPFPYRTRLYCCRREIEECFPRFSYPFDDNTTRVRGGARVLLRSFNEITCTQMVSPSTSHETLMAAGTCYMKCPDDAGCQDTALCCGPLDKQTEAQLTARQQAKAEKLARLASNVEQGPLV